MKDSSFVPSLAAIDKFLQGQITLCGLQCALFLAAAEWENSIDSVWMSEDIWEGVALHDTSTSRLVALVAGCVWAKKPNHTNYLQRLLALTPAHLMPYDEGRYIFLTNFAQRVCSERSKH